MRPRQHRSNNDVLHPPQGATADECKRLFVTRVVWAVTRQQGVWSYWRPSPEELALLQKESAVRLAFIGRTHPPVALGVEGDGFDVATTDTKVAG